ncbi:MAG: hypothetical protein RLZ12_61 [Bacillota bacterium]|jgi:cytidylate kinase
MIKKDTASAWEVQKELEQIKPFWLAIDGPAGSGKSTVARYASERLKLPCINTGLVYRLVAYKLMQEKRDLSEHAEIEALVSKLTLACSNKGLILPHNNSDGLYQDDVSLLTPKIAGLPGVRELVTKKLQLIAAERALIMEGRDIGTVVLPTAELKLFITAALAVRVKRRAAQLARCGIHIELDKLHERISQRDRLDQTRKNAPLMRAKDAVIVDTTELSEKDVVDKVVQLVQVALAKREECL